jgi:hypothetical protein
VCIAKRREQYLANVIKDIAINVVAFFAIYTSSAMRIINPKIRSTLKFVSIDTFALLVLVNAKN